MAKAINLLPKIAEAEIKSGVYQKRTNVISLALLLITSLFLVGLFVFRFIQVKSLDNLRADEVKKEGSIKSQQVKEVILRSISAKLKRIGSLLANSPKYSTYLDDLNSLGNLVITDAKIEAGKISISLIFPDSNSLSSFVNNLLEPDLGVKKFKNPSLSTLTYNSKDNVYKLAIKLERVK